MQINSIQLLYSTNLQQTLSQGFYQDKCIKFIHKYIAKSVQL